MTPREKIAMQRATERRQQVRTRLSLAIVSVVAVVAIVVAFIVVKGMSSNKSGATGSLPTGTTLSKIVSDVTNVPASTLAAVRKGTVQTPPSTVSGQPMLTQNGKPQIVYIGAEYCPYCAAERWAMAVALSRFGTFSNLGVTHSSTDPAEAYRGTNTLTFYKSTYSSPYIVFSPDEQTDPSRTTLQRPTAQEQQLLSKFDAAPYVPSAEAGAIPFIDFANRYLVSGASYSPQVLQGKTWSEIAAGLSNPSSPIAKAVDGTANVLTADICKLTNDKPANVCSTAPINSLNK